MSKIKVSLTDLILFTLEKIVRGGEIVLDSSQELKNWMYKVYSDYPKTVDNSSISQAIRRLREKGFIEQEKKEADKIVFRLTQQGKEFVLFKKDEGEWDGKWRIVIFDIPESKRLVRIALRRKLKNWGFVAWQKSVWATKKNLTFPIRALIKDLGIDDWVRVLESDNVGD